MPKVLLLDIGNTHTHVAIADDQKVQRVANLRTAAWADGTASGQLQKFVGKRTVDGACLCSVVPRATPLVQRFLKREYKTTAIELTCQTVAGVGVDYPHPETIGPDRLANAIAVKRYFGAPSVVVDFGTAVTFDVVNRDGNYIGGIIAPGLAAMTDYLHEKTALLPRIEIREPRSAIGRNTREAMLIGAVHGYRGLVRELLGELRRELKAPRLPVVATGGYAKLIASKLRVITDVEPQLTLEGLRLVWLHHTKASRKIGPRKVDLSDQSAKLV